MSAEAKASDVTVTRNVRLAVSTLRKIAAASGGVGAMVRDWMIGLNSCLTSPLARNAPPTVTSKSITPSASPSVKTADAVPEGRSTASSTWNAIAARGLRQHRTRRGQVGAIDLRMEPSFDGDSSGRPVHVLETRGNDVFRRVGCSSRAAARETRDEDCLGGDQRA